MSWNGIEVADWGYDIQIVFRQTQISYRQHHPSISQPVGLFTSVFHGFPKQRVNEAPTAQGFPWSLLSRARLCHGWAKPRIKAMKEPWRPVHPIRQNHIRSGYPIGSMVLLYMVTFTINIPQMLAYIYIYHTWILWDIWISFSKTTWKKPCSLVASCMVSRKIKRLMDYTVHFRLKQYINIYIYIYTCIYNIK